MVNTITIPNIPPCPNFFSPMNSGPYFAKKGKFGNKKVGEDKITTYEDYETAVLSIKASSELRQRLIFQNH